MVVAVVGAVRSRSVVLVSPVVFVLAVVPSEVVGLATIANVVVEWIGAIIEVLVDILLLFSLVWVVGVVVLLVLESALVPVELAVRPHSGLRVVGARLSATVGSRVVGAAWTGEANRGAGVGVAVLLVLGRGVAVDVRLGVGAEVPLFAGIENSVEVPVEKGVDLVSRLWMGLWNEANVWQVRIC